MIGLDLVVNGPLTPAHSLRERELVRGESESAGLLLAPLPQGEGWGEGTIHRRSKPYPRTSFQIRALN